MEAADSEQIPGRATDLSRLRCVRTSAGVQPLSVEGGGTLSPGGRSGRNAKLNLVRRLKLLKAILYCPIRLHGAVLN
jgi:hypothetical protein